MRHHVHIVDHSHVVKLKATYEDKITFILSWSSAPALEKGSVIEVFISEGEMEKGRDHVNLPKYERQSLENKKHKPNVVKLGEKAYVRRTNGSIGHAFTVRIRTGNQNQTKGGSVKGYKWKKRTR
ncbi:hypothetical protein VNO78_17860 [Psophocarpus tetragonolobus]|uniref:Uncharacterized protein n=1 Tax=Psophocarpus tetragonolobus TaxID=3891 RepID=A0AAN9XKY4_PSOTE